MRHLSALFVIMLSGLVVLLAGQGCSRNTRFSVDHLLSNPRQELSGGNGSGYDGKLRILHHYVDNFTCEGLARPESILIRDQSLQWYLIRNKPEKCAAIDRSAVQGVAYDEVVNHAIYQGDLYVPPRDYVVDSSEDPNLSGVQLDVGVCEDVNHKCSLNAAFMQGSLVSTFAPVVIRIPSGKYMLSTHFPTLFSQGTNNYPISIIGQDAATSIIDGGGRSIGFLIGSSKQTKISVSQLTFQNAIGAIEFYAGQASLDIDHCLFKNNFSAAVEVSTPSPAGVDPLTAVTIRNSQFTGNQSVAIHIQGPLKVLVEDTSIDNTTGRGLWTWALADLTVRRVTISNSSTDAGMDLENCQLCSIENVTLFGNMGGIKISSDSSAPNGKVSILNSTIVSNNTLYVGNLDFNLTGSSASNPVVLSNSILATNDPRKLNCSSANHSINLLSTNNLFDDSSCGVLSATDSLAAPLLAPLSNNGGPTWTMLPLPGSPAIDSGSNLLCPATDQRGLPRPVNFLGQAPRCDRGAVELQ